MLSQDDAFLDAVEPRIVATLGLRLAVDIGPAPSDERALADYVRGLGAILFDAIARQGWRTTVPLPGETQGVRRIDDLPRMLFAAPLWSGGDMFGVLLTVVIAGRSPSITVAPPNCVIPADETAPEP